MATQTAPPASVVNEVQTTAERALTITCCCLVGVTFILRSTGRYALKEKLGAGRVDRYHFFGLDDIFNFLAVLTFYGLAVAVFTAIDRGMGTHIEVVLYNHGQKGLDRYNLAIYICAIFYNTVLGMVKLSVLSLYRRILQGAQSSRMTKINWAVFIIVSMNTTANVLVAAFQCNPVKAVFTSSMKGKCINASAFYIGNAITGVITDTMVYLLAIPIIKPLQMDMKRKAVTLLTFLVGAFAVVTSAVRLSFLPALLTNPDATWAMGIPMDWSVVEPTVGIIVSSIPAITSIRHLFRKPGQHSSNLDSSLQSNRHIKLHDFGDNAVNNTTSIKGAGDRRKMANDDSGSEERLVDGWKGSDYISRTTEVQVSYAPKDT